MLLIEIMLLLTSFFPFYHLFTAMRKRKAAKKTTFIERSFTILVPCYNESVCIKKTIEALTKLEYINYEVIFINDGSMDETFSILSKELSLSFIDKRYSIGYFRSLKFDNFFCIDKQNSGKALSLNEGIKCSRGEFIVTLDADSMLNPNCLKVLNLVFSNKNVAAAGGAIHIMQANDDKYLKRQSLLKRLLIKIQSADYLKGFFIYKLSLSKQNALAIISGAFGAFRKSILQKVGGFRQSLGEDIDITIKIHKHIAGTNQQIVYLPDALCYTECPESIGDLFRQRVRWQKGFVDCAVYHNKFLIKNCLKNPVCFYLVFEAILIGLFSSILPIVTTAALLFTGNLLRLLFILYICMIANILYSLLAYYIAARHIFPYKKKRLGAIIWDIFLLKPFLAFVYLYGTAAYFLNKNDWKKTRRSTALAKN